MDNIGNKPLQLLALSLLVTLLAGCGGSSSSSDSSTSTTGTNTQNTESSSSSTTTQTDNTTASSTAEGCSPADNINWATGSNECLRLKTQNSVANPKALVIFIHGDVSSGGPADYFAIQMFRVAPETNNFAAVTLIRPGYSDSQGNTSTGDKNNSLDNYTAANIDVIAAAITNLKAHYNPEKVVVVGHSGGAAITGVMLGKHPDLIDSAVLAACPCNITEWREHRGGAWPNSLSPSDFVSAIAKDTVVKVIVGSEDDNTYPQLSVDYVAALKEQSIDVDYQLLNGVGHNGVAASSELFAAAVELAK